MGQYSEKGFDKHECFESHQFSYNVWKRKRMIESEALKSIADKLCPNASEIARVNTRFLRLFKYVLWFTTNSVATGGYDETEESKEQGN